MPHITVGAKYLTLEIVCIGDAGARVSEDDGRTLCEDGELVYGSLRKPPTVEVNGDGAIMPVPTGVRGLP
jgi:hypothetical protein